MDPVTHGLTGAVISNIFPKRKATLAVMMIASLAPDVDYITRLWGLDIFLRYHRGLTHGILSLFVFSVLTGVITSAFIRKNSFYYTMLSFTGYGIHLLMDLTNQYPTRILSPLDWSKYSLNLTFIIDPYIIVALIVGLLFIRRKNANRRRIAAVLLILITLYISTRAYLKDKTEDFLRTELDEYYYSLSPLPNDFSRWWFVTRSENTYRAGIVDLLTKSVCVQKEFVYTEDEPEIRESKQIRTVRNFLYFARFPLPMIERRNDETIVTWRELSYSFMPGDHFIARIRFDSKGRVVEEYFRF